MFSGRGGGFVGGDAKLVVDEESGSGAWVDEGVYSSRSVYPSKSNPRELGARRLEHLEGALQVAGVHAHRDSGFKRYPPSLVYARCGNSLRGGGTGVIESFFRAVTFYR